MTPRFLFGSLVLVAVAGVGASCSGSSSRKATAGAMTTSVSAGSSSVPSAGSPASSVPSAGSPASSVPSAGSPASSVPSAAGPTGPPAPATNPATTKGGGGSQGGATAPASQNPCTLVTKAEAQAILGGQVADPVEATQGPTCIYQATDPSAYITLAVSTVDFNQLKPQIAGLQPVSGLTQAAYCGTYGKPTLWVPLSGTRVLSVTASCPVATKFAAKALPRLPGA